MITATPAQEALIRKMMQSHLFTEDERAGIERRLTEGFTGSPGQCVDWLMSEIKARKQAEKEAAEREQETLPI